MGKKGRIIPWPLSKHLTKSRGGGWLLSACRYPRTESFAAGRGGGDGDLQRAATLEDIDRFLHENFNSLYDGCVEGDEGDSGEMEGDGCRRRPGGGCDDDDGGGARESRIVLASSASQRFFVPSSPGKPGPVAMVIDGHLIARGDSGTAGTRPPSADDYASSSTTATTTMTTASSASASSSSPDCQHVDTAGPGGGGIPDDGVAVVISSKDPQDDFFRSMEEMLDTHLLSQQKPFQGPVLVDWVFMQDLLVCYLDLNHGRVHDHILQAFAHLVAELRNRNDVVLSEEPGRAGGGGASARFYRDGDDETDPPTEDSDDCYYYDDGHHHGAPPAGRGAMFSASRY